MDTAPGEQLNHKNPDRGGAQAAGGELQVMGSRG